MQTKQVRKAISNVLKQQGWTQKATWTDKEKGGTRRICINADKGYFANAQDEQALREALLYAGLNATVTYVSTARYSGVYVRMRGLQAS